MDTDSHTGFPRIEKSYEELKKFELIPYEAAIGNGADMLLLPGVWNDSTFKTTDSAAALIVKMVKDGRIREEEIDDSVLRILMLKEKHGLLEESDFAVSDGKVSAAKEIIGCAEHKEKSHETARQALTLLKNENSAYPISSGSGNETLILFSGSAASRIGYGELLKEKLPEENITLMVSTKENEQECLDVASRVENVILSYCSSELKSIPTESGAGCAYCPNLEEAILSCFRGNELNGRSPCDLKI